MSNLSLYLFLVTFPPFQNIERTGILLFFTLSCWFVSMLSQNSEDMHFYTGCGAGVRY